MNTPPLTLSADEIIDLTGGYVLPAKQLAELRQQGFWRARRSRLDGRVILERPHYDAVCRAQGSQGNPLMAESGPLPDLLP